MQSVTTSEAVRRGEIVAGLMLAVLGGYVATQSLTWEVFGRSGPGPGFFPLIYGTLMVVLSLVLVVRSASRWSAAPSEPMDWRGVGVAMVLWLAFAASVPVMKYFGFLIALALLMFFIARVVFSRPIAHALAAALVAPPLFYAVFTFGLQVRLPVGSLTGF
jgi:putative tricarboxylic transport membrane protein